MSTPKSLLFAASRIIGNNFHADELLSPKSSKWTLNFRASSLASAILRGDGDGEGVGETGVGETGVGEGVVSYVHASHAL